MIPDNLIGSHFDEYSAPIC